MSPTISRQTCRAILDLLPLNATGQQFTYRPEDDMDLQFVRVALKLALSPKRIRPVSKKRAGKSGETRALRAAAMARAGAACEGCGQSQMALEMDHAMGRRGPQSIETVWILCRFCHRKKTDSKPSAAYWLEDFAAHCCRHGYVATSERALSRLAFVNQRTQFGAKK